MIIDSIDNADKYSLLNPLFAKAFTYLRSADLSALENGKISIDGDTLFGIVAAKIGSTVAESTAFFECHNAHIDIQFCISGKEQFGWKPRASCLSPRGEYSVAEDVLFYEDAPDMFFGLTSNQFVIFYPEDVHAPMIGEEWIKKIVIKVKL